MEGTELGSILFSIQGIVKKVELKLENEIDRKISALFDAYIDELRYRKENKETREKMPVWKCA